MFDQYSLVEWVFIHPLYLVKIALPVSWCANRSYFSKQVRFERETNNIDVPCLSHFLVPRFYRIEEKFCVKYNFGFCIPIYPHLVCQSQPWSGYILLIWCFRDKALNTLWKSTSWKVPILNLCISSFLYIWVVYFVEIYVD